MTEQDILRLQKLKQELSFNARKTQKRVPPQDAYDESPLLYLT